MKILIALPALNEEATIVEVVRSLPRELSGVEEVDCLVVDDGSSDRTAELAAQEGAIVVRHPENWGVGRAFQTALDRALRLGSDVLVTIDADGQFDPREIGSLIAPILKGSQDFVTGSRFTGGRRPTGMPRARFWGNKLVARIIRLVTGTRLSDVSCGFRAYSQEALLRLNLFGKFTYTQETILDMAFKELRLAEVPISVRYFEGRRSRVAGSLLKYALGASKIITRTVRDFRPLAFFGSVGLTLFVAGVVLDLWLLRHYVLSGSFSPYKVVGFAGAALNLFGLLVGGLGFVAEMLDRIRANQERMLYYLKRQAHSDPDEPKGQGRP